ncbi:MAG TPA: polyketide synthase, partial [Longimicrobium sp.]|nr:polyketide synthase [Longimicrobium sp.]
MSEREERAGDDNLDMAIAVIGFDARFPGARSCDEFWSNLEQGVESITVFDPPAGTPARGVAARGVLDDVELFDAAFFGYTRAEAEIMDPQQRLFLECAWAALENAGYDPQAVSGAAGVFAGSGNSSYQTLVRGNAELYGLMGSYRVHLANAGDFLATRVSYKLNLSGPSVAVQTACSTSLVAIHVACQSLLGEECDVALAGGVAIRLPQREGNHYQEGGIHSPDGHCRPFDARAQGTVGGSGVGVVVLKRLADALRDGDPVRALVLGSAVNNDGSRKIGFTAPSVEGQARAIAEALSVADVEPSSIGMIEAHGTATPLGDPIEVAALTQALGEGLPPASVALGSVKSNIGHCDAAAGVAGFLKATLALERGTIPASLHFERPNPELALEK